MQTRTLENELNHILHKEFGGFVTRIRNRENDTDKQDWLTQFHCKPHADYFYLTTLGYGKWTQKLNKGISKLSINLWRILFWKHISSLFLNHIKRAYLPYLEGKTGSFNIKKELDHLLNEHLHDFRNATVIELIEFTNKVFQAISVYIDGENDLLKTEKKKQNEQCLGFFEQIIEEVFPRKDALKLLVYLSIQFNDIDSFHPKATEKIDGLKEIFNEVVDQTIDLKLTKNYAQLENFLTSKKGQHILYECDNAGEIIIDLCLIYWSLLQGHRVTMVGKLSPVLNDVTVKDIHDLCNQIEVVQPFLKSGALRIIHANSHTVGKTINTVPEPYIDAYKKASMVILKGQGNFQSMPFLKREKEKETYSYIKPHFHLFIVKSRITQLSLNKAYNYTESAQIGTFKLIYNA